MSDQPGVTPPAAPNPAATATNGTTSTFTLNGPLPAATATGEDDEAQQLLADAVESPSYERLPDDHPAAKALRKANQEAETARLKIKEYEDRDKSELQKATEAREAAEKAAADATREALRYRIAAKHQISDEDADLFLTGTDEATITQQAERYAALKGATDAKTPAGGPVVPRSGTGGGNSSAGTVAAGRALYKPRATTT